MINSIYEIETNKYTLTVEYNEYYSTEDFLFNDKEVFYTNVPRYLKDFNTSYSLDDFESLEDIKEHHGEDYTVHLVNAYIHSGIALSLWSSYPFDCPWDSGLAGVLVLPKDVNAESYIKEWNSILAGEVYYFQLEEKSYCPCCEAVKKEELDSLGLIVGHDFLKDCILENIDLPENEETKELFDKIKEEI